MEREFADATHVTFAYRILDAHGLLHTRFSDDGEPSGTAGKPILMPLEGQDLINTAVFVVRYYGGTKLGAGGLVRAYGQTAKLVLQDAELGPHVITQQLRLTLPYEAQSQVDYLCKKEAIEVLERSFAEQVEMLIQLPAEKTEELLGKLPAAVAVSSV